MTQMNTPDTTPTLDDDTRHRLALTGYAAHWQVSTDNVTLATQGWHRVVDALWAQFTQTLGQQYVPASDLADATLRAEQAESRAATLGTALEARTTALTEATQFRDSLLRERAQTSDLAGLAAREAAAIPDARPTADVVRLRAQVDELLAQVTRLRDDNAQALSDWDTARRALQDMESQRDHWQQTAQAYQETGRAQADRIQELTRERDDLKRTGGNLVHQERQARANQATWMERALEAERDRDRFKADHQGACETIAAMYEAGTGRKGLGPIRGVVEDLEDVRRERLALADRIEDVLQDGAVMALWNLEGISQADHPQVPRLDAVEATRWEVYAGTDDTVNGDHPRQFTRAQRREDGTWWLTAQYAPSTRDLMMRDNQFQLPAGTTSIQARDAAISLAEVSRRYLIDRLTLEASATQAMEDVATAPEFIDRHQGDPDWRQVDALPSNGPLPLPPVDGAGDDAYCRHCGSTRHTTEVCPAEG